MDEETRTLMKKAMEGITQGRFAKIAGVSQAAISLWLSGKRKMHPAIEKHIKRTAMEILCDRQKAS